MTIIECVTPGVVEAVDAEGLGMSGLESLKLVTGSCSRRIDYFRAMYQRGFDDGRPSNAWVAALPPI